MADPHPVLQAALAVVPPRLHPKRRWEGPTPWFDVDGWPQVALWLVDRVRPQTARLDPAVREAFEYHVRLTKMAIADDLDGQHPFRQTLRTARAASSRCAAMKVAIWAGNEAVQDLAFRGRATRAAASQVAKLVRASASEATRLLEDLDALCVHEAAMTVCRRHGIRLPSPPCDTLWRGLTNGQPSHYLIRLAGRGVALLVGRRRGGFQFWEAHTGPTNEVLACVPDRHFKAAVTAHALAERAPR